MGLLDMFADFMPAEEKKTGAAPVAEEKVTAEATTETAAETTTAPAPAAAEEEDAFELSDYEAKPAKKAAPEKKAAPKSGSGSKEKSKDKDPWIKVPCQVISTGFKATLDPVGSENNIRLSEAARRLHEMGYKEAAIDDLSLEIARDDLLVLCEKTLVSETARNTQVFSDAVASINMGLGYRRMELSPENFSGMDEDEICAGDLIDRYGSSETLFAGASVLVTGSVAYPYFKTKCGEKEAVETPCEVFVNGEKVTVDSEDIKTVADLKKLYGVGAKVVVSIAKSGETYIVCYKQVTANGYKKGISVGSKPKGAVKERYPLPLSVYIGTWGKTYQLQPADFGGKEKIEAEDIKAYFAPKYPVFRDESRKMDLYYEKEDNILSIMFISGTKGSDAGLEVEETDSIRFFLNGSELVKAEFLLPKIPEALLDEVITLFRRDLTKELYVKIVQRDGQYRIIQPQQSVTRIAVDYLLDRRQLIGAVQVMDLHSHNTMSAVFSGTDDRDEIYPGLFGVLGNLDQDEISMNFRFGYNGSFLPVSYKDIFERE